MEPYATVEQLAAYWRTLTDAETARAGVLLPLASSRLRLMADRVNVDIDGQVANNQSYAATAQWVVLEAVKRAMLVPTDAPPANQLQKTAGPYSENIVFTNPSGDLWFKNSELEELGLKAVQSLSSISTTPSRDIYAS